MRFKVSKQQRFANIAAVAFNKPTPQATRTKPTAKSDQSEADVLKDCLSYLRGQSLYYPILCDRLNNGAGYTPYGGWSKFGIVGAGDIIATIGGRHFEIECKAGRGGQLSLEQVNRRALVEKSGGVYLIVHGRDELEAQLRPYFDKCIKNEGCADDAFWNNKEDLL